MDYCVFAERLGAKIGVCSYRSLQKQWRRRIFGARIESFTLIELIIMMAIIGILAGIALPLYADLAYRARVERAKWDVRQIESAINIYYYRYHTYPSSLNDVVDGNALDPWGRPYRYLPSSHPTWHSLQRRDRNMRPLNSDFDLYSMGADGLSAPALTSPLSLDDVLRAGNGSFVGLGADF
jgi:general secretion pathway protein G